jgi:hypothetical protein
MEIPKMAKAIAKGNTAPTSAVKIDKATSKGKGDKAKAKTSNAPTAYAEIRKLLDKPLDEIKPLPIGRNGAKVTPRRFHLLADDVKQLREQFAFEKRIPNPHNKGLYHYFIESLIALGRDKAHSFKAVKEKMRAMMSNSATKDESDKTAWQRFIGKESHSESDEGGLNVDGKLQQNAYVLQRLGGLTPYGLRLLQTGQQVLKSKGMVIDILKGKDGKEILYRLNTDSASPTNEWVRQRSAK